VERESVAKRCAKMERSPEDHEERCAKMERHWNDMSPEDREELFYNATVFDENWSSRFEELKVYHQLHGNCNVHISYNPTLYYWTNYQRSSRETVKVKRFQALDKIGFAWTLPNSEIMKWSSRFEELKVYHQLHGHCNVSKEENASLRKCLSEIVF